jgi:hypothetical protein
VASTTHEWNGFYLCCASDSGTDPDNFLIDISTGAASSEADFMIVENLMWGISGGSGPWNSMYMPIHVPAGSRISARGQSSTADAASDITLHGMAGGNHMRRCFRKAIGIGTSGADSGGVTLTLGLSNSMSGWSELTSSLSDDIGAIAICYSYGATSVTNHAYFMVDIGVGAAASEYVILQEITNRANTGADCAAIQWQGPFYYPVASGTRMAVRGQTAETSGTVAVDVSLIGFVL